MLPFGKQQDICDYPFDDKSRKAVRKTAGTLFIIVRMRVNRILTTASNVSCAPLPLKSTSSPNLS